MTKDLSLLSQFLYSRFWQMPALLFLYIPANMNALCPLHTELCSMNKTCCTRPLFSKMPLSCLQNHLFPSFHIHLFFHSPQQRSFYAFRKNIFPMSVLNPPFSCFQELCQLQTIPRLIPEKPVPYSLSALSLYRDFLVLFYVSA